jgi:hypothetical protein
VTITNIATKDNTLYQVKTGDPETSNARGDGIFAGNTDGKGGEPPFSRRAVIAFTNLHSVIPPGAVINSVTLRLLLNRTKETAGVPLTVHRLRGNWGEGTSNANGEEGKGANATSGDATWTYRFFNTVLWATPGGDYVASWSASNIVRSFSGDGQYYYWSSPQMVADVQLWLSNPGTNFGWIVIGKERDGANIAKQTAKRFASREDTYPTNRPALIIDYSVADPIGACNLPGGRMHKRDLQPMCLAGRDMGRARHSLSAANGCLLFAVGQLYERYRRGVHCIGRHLPGRRRGVRPQSLLHRADAVC